MLASKVGFLIFAVLLSGCGGGSDSANPVNGTPGGAVVPNLTGSAEGYWVGQTTAGTKIDAMILDNGELWGVTTDSRGGLLDMVVASTSGQGTQFKIPNMTDYAVARWMMTSASAAGTVSSKSNINVVSSNGTTIALYYDKSYETQAALSQAAGNYSISGFSSRGTVGNVPMNISVSGEVMIDLMNNCRATGSLQPRPNANVFNIALNFVGAGCYLGNGATTSGVMYVDTSVSSKVTRILTVTATRSDAFISEARKL